jgi:hypothetical protein
MSPCHLLLFMISLLAIGWLVPDILCGLGRAAGAIARLAKRYPRTSVFATLIALMWVVQVFHL